MFLSRRSLAALLLVCVLPACGGSGGGEPAAGAPADGGHGGHDADSSVQEPVDGAAEATVTAVDIDFKPATLTLKAGEPTNVTVVNEGSTLHDFTLDEADVHANVEPGAEVATAVTVAEPGVYKAICTVPGHADAGMVVDVTVE